MSRTPRRPRCSTGGAVGHRLQDEGGLEPPAVGVLVQGEVGAAVVEVQRRPQPETWGIGAASWSGARPRAAFPTTGPASGDLVRVDPELGPVDGDALPAAPLGQPGVVHHEDALVGDPALPWFLDRNRRARKTRSHFDPVLVRLDHVADGADGLGHLDPDRPPAVVRSTGMSPDAKTECSTSVEDDAEGGVDHAAHGVVAHGGAEVEVSVPFGGR